MPFEIGEKFMEIFSFYSQEIIEKLSRKEVRYFVGSCLLCLLIISLFVESFFKDILAKEDGDSFGLSPKLILRKTLRYLFDFNWIGSFLFSVLVLEAYLLLWLLSWSVVLAAIALIIF